MAIQETAPAPAPSAELVGNAFVQQYYHILHQSPGLVHKFYQDVSLLSRPDTDGNITTVTTMQAINDKILSLNYEDYTAEIKYADAQESYEKGVIVLVTGCLTGKDNVTKKFSQTFFLAPQDKGYYVLNDVFRFVGENESFPSNSILVKGINDNSTPITSTAQPGWGDTSEAGWGDTSAAGWGDTSAAGWGDTSEADPPQASDCITVDHATSFEDENINNGAEVYDPSDEDEGYATKEDVVEHQIDLMHNEILASADSAPAALEDAPKKSYASILKVMKGSVAPHSVHSATSNSKVPPGSSEKQLPSTAKPANAPDAAAPTMGNAPESNDAHEEGSSQKGYPDGNTPSLYMGEGLAEGHSIYVRNLPINATETLLDETFKNFGPIRRGGIQVRSNKQGFCFGFVEFERFSSMQSALEASPINIGDRQAIVEEKKTNIRVGSSGRGRYSSSRGGFRSDSFKNRGNFGGGRGYGRSEFKNQGEFAERPKGATGRNGEDYQRANRYGGRRGGRQNEEKGSTDST